LAAYLFQIGSTSTRIRTCRSCQVKKHDRYTERRDKEAEASGKSSREVLVHSVNDDVSEDGNGSAGLSVIPLELFLDILQHRNDALHVEAHVDLSDSSWYKEALDIKAIADKLASLTWEAMSIRFVCVVYFI